MTDSNARSSRRSFFLYGGAVLGAGVATTAGAAALMPGASRAAAASHDDREAIRQLQLTFMACMEERDYVAVTELFTDQARLDLGGVSATGKAGIACALAEQYRAQRAANLHSAYRQNGSQRQDTISLDADGRRAAATFHTEVEISTPLTAHCTAAQMARLQGQMAERRWESGRFEARYEKTRGQWRIAALRYS